MPQPPTVIDTGEKIDYSKLSKMIAKETSEANAKQKKEYFLLDPKSGEVIRIESKSGIRTTYRSEPTKPTGQNLQ